MDEILKNEWMNPVKMRPDSALMSFDDCPNKCTFGYIFDPYIHKKTLCPYCEEQRRKMVYEGVVEENGKTIAQLLGLQETLMGTLFDRERIVPAFARKELVETSVDRVLDKMKDLLDKASAGELLDRSYLFNLGAKCIDMNFYYPYMLRYYKAGKTVAPLMTPMGIVRLRRLAEEGMDVGKNEVSFYDIVNRDVCVVTMDAGTTRQGIGQVKGLMQLRAQKEKATVIVTNVWGDAVRTLCKDSDVEEGYFQLAEMYSVEYLKKEPERGNTQSGGLYGNRGVASMTKQQLDSLRMT